MGVDTKEHRILAESGVATLSDGAAWTALFVALEVPRRCRPVIRLGEIGEIHLELVGAIGSGFGHLNNLPGGGLIGLPCACRPRITHVIHWNPEAESLLEAFEVGNFGFE